MTHVVMPKQEVRAYNIANYRYNLFTAGYVQINLYKRYLFELWQVRSLSQSYHANTS